MAGIIACQTPWHLFNTSKILGLKPTVLVYLAIDITESHAMDPIEKVLQPNIPHVALYGLAILKNTPFHTMGMTIDDDQQADQYDTIQGILNSNGYHQYSIKLLCHGCWMLP